MMHLVPMPSLAPLINQKPDLSFDPFSCVAIFLYSPGSRFGRSRALSRGASFPVCTSCMLTRHGLAANQHTNLMLDLPCSTLLLILDRRRDRPHPVVPKNLIGGRTPGIFVRGWIASRACMRSSFSPFFQSSATPSVAGQCSSWSSWRFGIKSPRSIGPRHGLRCGRQIGCCGVTSTGSDGDHQNRANRKADKRPLRIHHIDASAYSVVCGYI
jgi:hypothetical protein